MDFAPTDEQATLAEAARQFARNALAPHAARWDETHHFPLDVLKQAGELGFCGLYISEEQGGLGLSRLTATMIFEELSWGCTTTAAYLSIHNMAATMIARHATPACGERWLPGLTSGGAFASYCLTEPNAGSDAGNLTTRAERGDEGSYSLRGSKSFISGAGATDVLVVMARTGEPGSGARGITAFAVAADTPGVSFGENEKKLGWNAQPTRAVHFDGAVVPAENRLGAEGQGFSIAMAGLDGGRLNIAACSLGTAQAALERARDYLHERRQFGKKLADFQALQFRLADMLTRQVAARQLLRLAAWKLDQRHPDATSYCAMAKRFVTDACFEVVNDALQLHGGYGYLRDYPLERYLRDVRVHQILEGTNEIMRLIVGRAALAHAAFDTLL